MHCDIIQNTLYNKHMNYQSSNKLMQFTLELLINRLSNNTSHFQTISLAEDEQNDAIMIDALSFLKNIWHATLQVATKEDLKNITANAMPTTEGERYAQEIMLAFFEKEDEKMAELMMRY